MPRLTSISSKSDLPAAHQGLADDVLKVFGPEDFGPQA